VPRAPPPRLRLDADALQGKLPRYIAPSPAAPTGRLFDEDEDDDQSEAVAAPVAPPAPLPPAAPTLRSTANNYPSLFSSDSDGSDSDSDAEVERVLRSVSESLAASSAPPPPPPPPSAQADCAEAAPPVVSARARLDAAADAERALLLGESESAGDDVDNDTGE
jgi:hypothetical protein